MNISKSIFKRNDDVAWRDIEGEALVVDSRKGLIYPLNETATRIWELLDGRKTCDDIVAAIEDEFEEARSSIYRDAMCFFEDGVKKGLIERCG